MLKKIMKFKYNFNPVLHNRIVLYFFSIIALFDLIYFLNINDMYSFAILILTGFLTSFFIKNMVVILFVALIVTHVLKYGNSTYSEGYEGVDADKPDKKESKKGSESSKDEKKSNSNFEISDASSKLKEFTKKIDTIKKTKGTDEEVSRSELIDKLPEIKETRNKILSQVEQMEPLLEKFQGYIEKFNQYKETMKNKV